MTLERKKHVDSEYPFGVFFDSEMDHHVGIAMSQTTHQIDGWNPTHKTGDEWGMVYCYTNIIIHITDVMIPGVTKHVQPTIRPRKSFTLWLFVTWLWKITIFNGTNQQFLW